jgi:uncharacterized repeat protein (TIGR02543 family)
MRRLFFAITIISLCLFFSCEEAQGPFKVTYYDNGSKSEPVTGYPPVDTNQYKSGEYATVLDSALQRTGYEFRGWSTKKDGSGTLYNTGDQIKIENKNIFLYAVWEE